VDEDGARSGVMDVMLTISDLRADPHTVAEANVEDAVADIGRLRTPQTDRLDGVVGNVALVQPSADTAGALESIMRHLASFMGAAELLAEVSIVFFVPADDYRNDLYCDRSILWRKWHWVSSALPTRL
jgi:hypothetical protein